MRPTAEQALREALLYLGGSKDDGRGMKEGVTAHLFELGILYIRPDGSTDLTAFGESVYSDLLAGDDVPGLSE